MPGANEAEGHNAEGQDPNNAAPFTPPSGSHPTIKCPTKVSAQSVTTFKAGDTLPDLIVVLQDADGNPVDLTDAQTIMFRMGAPMDLTPKVDAAATPPTDLTTGVVTYPWASGDLDTAQDWRGEFHVTWTDGKEITFPNATYLPISVLPLA
ncbi:hypothetical protein CCAX7_000250 [Capsulimonas corticalis]|uniref:Uncharacterized protein n=1 Tax=Capsulimonas corticalis TaxID=2219043 RepID=A0A402CR38_9BACT|nr:hypothetical protein [Capsulimonas corticalis]BDI27974.1 hypothetical protein CCAX7_000250 [Capsulimonas corticalis]